MNKQMLVLSILAGVLIVPVCVFADDSHNHAAEVPTTATAEVPAGEITAVDNKICPVGGEKVGEMGPAFEIAYNGKTYKLCCEMCAKEFMKDPAKYSKMAEEEAQKVQ